MTEEKTTEPVVTRKDLARVARRNIFGLQLGWNYEKMQGLGYCYTVLPILKKLYKDDPDKMKAALQNHLGFFNTTPAMSHLIVGANTALEEKLKGSDQDAVTGLKTGLMGPFAGVGDTLFVAIYRTLVFSIAAYLALQGQAVGLLIPLIAGFVILYIRYKFTFIGYNQGQRLTTEFGGQLKNLTEAAAILGLTVIGALIPAVIKPVIPLAFNIGKVKLDFQTLLNQIIPGIIPIAIVLFSYWLLGKKKMTSTRLLFILLAIGIILGNLANIVKLF
ncbi:PTS system mannose/fructose/sorbose family transporter subunit IID [Sporolactobacillus vineae]|uniref:PTS system mannose/fructose/sorbose family transporter subunit IID n=1 Tax=Sporolactobacillus vineae TaxID=444463 RepID=UPI000289102A|nr:PTS system mannose/fructose/sorbose family transporter subunit IID [Sporolactobacillus vineae]